MRFGTPSLLLMSVLLSLGIAFHIASGETADISPDDLSSEQKQRMTDLTEDASVRRFQILRFQPDLLAHDVLTLRLFADLTVMADQKTAEEANGMRTWQGTIRGVEQSQLYVNQSIQTGDLMGKLWMGNQTFLIIPLGENVNLVLDLDSSAFPPDEGSDPERIQRMEKEEEQHGSPATDGFDDGSELRVMIAYTPAAVAEIGADQLELFSQTAITDTNLVYFNSGITPRLKLSYFTTVNYTESGDIDEDIERLTDTDDGYMDEIHQLRTDSGADMVALITDTNVYPDACGIAEEIDAEESDAFVIVARNCVVGNYSFTHELGHLQGARHDWYVDWSPLPYLYGHGYTHPDSSPDDSWRTVMAYEDACEADDVKCPRIPYFSNPFVSYRGEPTGTETWNHNSRVLNETAEDVAEFRALSEYFNRDSYVNLNSEDVEAAYTQLTVEGTSQLGTSAQSTFIAPTVSVKGDFHALAGSSLHIHTGY